MPILITGGGGGEKVDNKNLPDQITNFALSLQKYKNILTWTNPTDIYFCGLIIVRKVNSAPNTPSDGITVYKGIGTTFTDTNLEVSTHYYYRSFPYNTYGQYQTEITGAVVDGTTAIADVYTIQIDQSNSDPATCCTYVGNHLDAGSDEWDTFFGEKPCLFKNGAVVGYLNPNDFAQFTDGSSADITSGNSGDIMIEFPRRGLNISTSGSVVTISVTNATNDSNYSYLAHTRGSTAKNNFYLGAYKGSDLSSKLRSLSGKQPTVNKTIGAFRTLAQANGTGYDQHAFYQLTFLQCMYVLKYANLNSQATVGMGWVGSSAATTTGNTNMNGMTYGTTSGIQQVKLFGIEDFWGNVMDCIDGLYCDSSRNILTATDNFNDTGSGYINQGSGGTADISGHMSVAQGNTTTGFIGKTVDGSTTTYYCDYCHLASNFLPMFGGYWNRGGNAGTFSLYLINFAFKEADSLGARLMYL